MEKKLHILGASAVSMAAILWGIDQILIRPNLFHIENVALIVFIEHLIGFLIMSTFCLYGIKEIKNLDIKDWASFFWVSLFGGAIGTMSIVKALMLVQFHHLSIVALLQKLQPVFAIMVAMLLLGERPRLQFYLWASLALLGSYFVTFGFKAPGLVGTDILMSSLYAILAAFAFGSSTSFGKHAIRKVSFSTAAYIRFGMTTIITLLILLATGGFSYFDRLMPTDFAWFIVIALTSGSAAMFIYYYGLKKITASVSTICELFYPLTAVILDYVVNGSVLSAGQLFGTVILIGSITKIAFLKKA